VLTTRRDRGELTQFGTQAPQLGDEERGFEWFESKGYSPSPNPTHQLMWVKS
jgi:hypothetical protein